MFFGKVTVEITIFIYNDHLILVQLCFFIEAYNCKFVFAIHLQYSPIS